MASRELEQQPYPEANASSGCLLEALRQPNAIGFLLKHVPEFYASVAINNQEQARWLVQDSFTVLDARFLDGYNIDVLKRFLLNYVDFFKEEDYEGIPGGIREETDALVQILLKNSSS